MSNYVLVLPDELYHHGIKGQKWGVRRFQYADGTLTKAGQIRYSYGTKAVKKRSEQEAESHNQYKNAHSRWVDAWKENNPSFDAKSATFASHIQNELNSLDKLQAATNKAKGIGIHKINKLDEKIDKLSDKKQTKKVTETIEKLKKAKIFEEESFANVSKKAAETREHAEWLVNEYSSMGFDIKSRPTGRIVNFGHDVAAYALAGPVGLVAYEAITAHKGYANTQIGTQYKVRYNH